MTIYTKNLSIDSLIPNFICLQKRDALQDEEVTFIKDTNVRYI